MVRRCNCTPNRSATCSAIWAPSRCRRGQSPRSLARASPGHDARAARRGARHPRLLERRRHQIDRCSRIALCGSSFGHRHSLDQTSLQHLVFHLHLVGGQKETFDELNCAEFPGETLAVREVFGLDRVRLQRTGHGNPGRPSFLVIE